MIFCVVVVYFKEIYSNICMKIHINSESKLTEYLIDILKMRFQYSNAEMEFLRNLSGDNGTLFSYMDLPSIFTHIESMGNPLIPDAENALCGLLLSEFKKIGM